MTEAQLIKHRQILQRIIEREYNECAYYKARAEEEVNSIWKEGFAEQVKQIEDEIVTLTYAMTLLTKELDEVTE